jgi:hypothetical protein
MFIDFRNPESHLKYFSVTRGQNVSFTVRTKDYRDRVMDFDKIIDLHSLPVSKLRLILELQTQVEKLCEELRLQL